MAQVKNKIESLAYEEKSQIRSEIRRNSIADFSFVFMNVMATVVASYGLLADSAAVVIGAMLIAMLLGPITGIALGLVDGNKRLLRIAFSSELIGVIVVLFTAFVIGWMHSDLPTGKEIASRTSPNIIDLIIALAGGAAGAYAVTTPRISAGLIGVAISTALVPPLSTCAILLARGEYQLAFGGFLLFFANFAAIQFSSSLVLWIRGFHQLTEKSEEHTKRIIWQNLLSLLVLLILAVLLGYNFLQTAKKQSFERESRRQLKRLLETQPATTVTETQFRYEANKTIVTAVLRTPFVFTKEKVSEVEESLPKQDGNQTELHIRSVITTETTKEGNIE